MDEGSTMRVRTVSFAALIEEDARFATAINYAIALCESGHAHLSCTLAAPILDLPTGRILPMVHALADQVNAERLAKAKEAEVKIEAASRLSGVPFDCRIVQKRYVDARAALLLGARTSDLAVLPQADTLSLAGGVIEAMLFESGRPVIVVPEAWTKGAVFGKIVIAWNGSARAARAVGDAAPLLARAEEVEVVCVTSPGEPTAAGADLAKSLARHCGKLKLTELPISHADAGRAINEHVANVRADLVVMGAYGHSRPFVEFILGGVTQTMLTEAKLPVLFSY
jgi:nucleotide-binding universal stress UspA family protein